MADHYETARIDIPTRDAGAVETALDLAMRAAGYLQASAADVPFVTTASGEERGERLTLSRGDGVVRLATSGAVALPMAIVLSTALGKTVEVVLAQGLAIGRDVTVTLRKLVVERGKVTEEPIDAEPFEHECSDREMSLLAEVVAEATEEVIGAHPFAGGLRRGRRGGLGLRRRRASLGGGPTAGERERDREQHDRPSVHRADGTSEGVSRRSPRQRSRAPLRWGRARPHDSLEVTACVS